MTNIEDLKEDVQILEMLEHYGAETWRVTGPYRQDGWNAINCPFCGDTNGSGSVNPAAGLFLCHQCGAPKDGRSGDVIDIVRDQENMGVWEAIEWIRSTFLL